MEIFLLNRALNQLRTGIFMVVNSLFLLKKKYRKNLDYVNSFFYFKYNLYYFNSLKKKIK